jgi:hypothetical protein
MMTEPTTAIVPQVKELVVQENYVSARQGNDLSLLVKNNGD